MKWSEEHEEFVRKNAGTMTDQAIGEKVGRNKLAVARKRLTMGIVKARFGTMEPGEARAIVNVRKPMPDHYFNVREVPCWITGVKP
jgi:hypothetical protein